MVLQTIFYPFELYSSTCGQTALDVRWDGDTFSGGKYALPVLDVSATLDKWANNWFYMWLTGVRIRLRKLKLT